jgi:hypothetical protein
MLLGTGRPRTDENGPSYDRFPVEFSQGPIDIIEKGLEELGYLVK